MTKKRQPEGLYVVCPDCETEYVPERDCFRTVYPCRRCWQLFYDPERRALEAK